MATSITGFNTQTRRDGQDIWHFDVDREGVVTPFDFTLGELINAMEIQSLTARFRGAELQLWKKQGADDTVLDPIRDKIAKAQNNLAELRFGANIIGAA